MTQSPWRRVLSEFVSVASTAEIPKGEMRKVTTGGQQVLIANDNGKFYAIGSVCTHMGGPLAEGILEGHEVECPWHGSRFDVTNGQVKHGPAGRPEPVFEVRIEANNILLRPKQ
ncbi:MAG TPA: non-heme iron oxygenase ferredoxin subunit [Candidatus Bathyarchaeia archaeon]|nr:non-heme iron oxygenase ferredoxin subunit [Candidatus Bathyarchaeia archaeon]